jgi:hypothetical protein
MGTTKLAFIVIKSLAGIILGVLAIIALLIMAAGYQAGPAVIPITDPIRRYNQTPQTEFL